MGIFLNPSLQSQETDELRQLKPGKGFYFGDYYFYLLETHSNEKAPV
jgi:hypothetical protein